MSFIKKIFDPDPPDFQSQDPEDTPSYEDEQRELEQRRLLEDQERKRKGRRSTILTDPGGLNEIADENIDQKVLLGG
tara:strand:+ start:2249 stop:2479 length:231 start_codon:yes stop_codon:yes gene_type:complete